MLLRAGSVLTDSVCLQALREGNGWCALGSGCPRWMCSNDEEIRMYVRCCSFCAQLGLVKRSSNSEALCVCLSLSGLVSLVGTDVLGAGCPTCKRWLRLGVVCIVLRHVSSGFCAEEEGEVEI